MPNYCSNELVVEFYHDDGPGKHTELLEFIRETLESYKERAERAKKSPETYKLFGVEDRSVLDFNSIIPYPDEYRQRDKDKEALSPEDFLAKYGSKDDGYNSGGYEWCINNWGSKWNASDSCYFDKRNAFYFETAWSPVFQIIAAIHKRFPTADINYEYYESGAGVMGGCTFLSKDNWDPSDYGMGETFELEKKAKLHLVGAEPEWEAGIAYNVWSQDYQGYKGG